MNLGKLKRILDTLIEDNGATAMVPYGFGNAISWRGIYAEPAFEPCGPTTLGDMRAEVERALTETFQGYKGGEFTYGEFSTAHLDAYGDYTEGAAGRLEMLMAHLIVMLS